MSTIQRGHATMCDNDMSNYFNQKSVIPPIRKGPRLFRKKSKVDTDLIRQSYMNECDNNNRIHLWYANKGINNAVKVNYGMQVLNLTAGAQHNPTIPRKLEDEDYRCDDAKVRQDELLPLSRLPRPSTSIDINPDASGIYNKSISSSDIERQRVSHSIKGYTRKIAEAFPVQTARGIQFQNISDYQQASDALNTNIIRDKMASNTMPLNAPIKTINTEHTDHNYVRTTINSKLSSLSRMANKQLNAPGINAGQHDHVVRVVRKLPPTSNQAEKTVVVYESNQPKHLSLISKLKGMAHDAHKTVTLYEITDPNIYLLAKLKSDPYSASKQVSVYSIKEPTNLHLNTKIVGDKDRAATIVKTKSVYTDTDHERSATSSARFTDRVKMDTSINPQYKLGGTMDPNIITNRNVNTNLVKKNAYCEGGIDTSMFSSHREQFDRTIPFYNTEIPYTKGPGFVFVDTKPVNSRVEFTSR